MLGAADNEAAVMLDHLIEELDIERLIVDLPRNHIHIEPTTTAVVVILVTVINSKQFQHLLSEDCANQGWLLKHFASCKSLKDILHFVCVNMY
jgi:hypothetical protein